MENLILKFIFIVCPFLGIFILMHYLDMKSYDNPDSFHGYKH